jgi:hypothetical protein
MVIVGDFVGFGEVRDHGIVGDAPDLAARLQVSAQPDTVTIGPTTWRLIGNLFDCRDLGALDTNSDTEPIHRWQVLGESVVASRFEALRGSKLTPLVGRDEEIDLLLRRWARVKAGDGQIMLVSGEAGLGKSRISAAFEERLHGEPHLRLRYFCSPYHQDSALFPVIDQLGRAAGFTRDDPPASKLAKLEALLAPTAPPDEDMAFLADLMSLPASERHPLPNLSPQRKKERTLEALMGQLDGLAHEKPVVTVWEDAHWLDPTSWELLDLTVERVRSLPVLLIVTFRPEFQPPWTGQPQVSMLALNRLDRRDCTALISQIAGSKALPDEVVFQIAARTDGVPLFVEELTKSILERGLLREENDRYVLDRPLEPLAIPATLHASLLARLDRLRSARPVAQIGAAIGRQFSYALARAVSRLPEDELQAALGQLVASELVFQRGTPPDAVYSFKHALVQDAAHGSLLRNARQHLHAQIAETLENHSSEITENQPELLAQHYAAAGLVEKAAAFWGKAGHRSVARSAMAEAAAQLQKGLDQLALLPDIPERRQKELEFSSALGAVLNVVQRLGRAGDGPGLRSRARVVGTARFPRGVHRGSLRAVPLSRASRRIGCGVALGSRFAAPEPSTERFRRARNGSLLVRSKPDVGRQFCLVPITPRNGARALRSELPSPAPASDRSAPAVGSTGGFGGRPLLSRLSRPGIGREQQGNCRGAQTASSADFGYELGDGRPSAIDDRRRFGLGAAGGRLGCGRDRSGFPLLPSNRSDLPWVGQSQKRRCDRGSVSSACRFERVLRHWGHGVDAVVYCPPGRGM